MSLYAETIARLGHANALRPSLSPRSDAAKACARFVQPSRERETPLPPAASMRARYASRDSRLRSMMRSVTAARTGFNVGEKSTMVGCYRRQGADLGRMLHESRSTTTFTQCIRILLSSYQQLIIHVQAAQRTGR